MDTTLLNLTANPTLADIWMPTDGSSRNMVDAPLYFILAICGIFLVFNAGLMIFFAIRYRQTKKEGAVTGSTHNTALEVTWSILPAFILAIIFIWGFKNYLVMATPPDNAYDITVTGYKWGWNFTYPDGLNSKSDGENPVTGDALPAALHAPAGRPVRLTLQSQDVLHSVFLPQLRVKKDVVPGRFNQMWFEAEFDESTAEEAELPTEDGGTVTVKRNVYDLFCTEYCGQNHSRMITKVYIYQPDDYKKWYVSKSLYDNEMELTKLGETIWATQCKSCHSVDGSGTGQYPTWQNLYGTTGHATSGGTVDVDDAYIIESIRNPAAKLAPKPGGGNYPNQMAAFPALSDREVRGVIEYMKSISDKVAHDPELKYKDLNIDGSLKGEAGGEAGGTEGEGAAPEAAPETEGEGSAEDEYKEAAQAAVAG